MKSRSSLAMMEQLVMLLVFALSAALCLQAFVKSDQLSRTSEARDHAVVLCQSAAEVIRSTKGDFRRAAELLGSDQLADEHSFMIMYDTDWNISAPVSPGVYLLGYTLGVARMETDAPGLGKAAVWAQDDETGEDLFRLEVCWQEVSVR